MQDAHISLNSVLVDFPILMATESGFDASQFALFVSAMTAQSLLWQNVKASVFVLTHQPPAFPLQSVVSSIFAFDS